MTISHGNDGVPEIDDTGLGPEGGKVELPEGERLEAFKSLMEHMGVEPDGTVPPLLPELQACVVEREMGTMINHPYLHEFYNAMENGRYNKVFEAKKEQIEKYTAEGRWDVIFLIGLVERPYALTYLLKWADDMPDETFWEIAGDIWTDSENIWQYADEWCQVLSDDRPGREHMMSDSADFVDGDFNEREQFEQLPEVIEVYRGTSHTSGGSNLSWTRKRSVAEMFAKRFQRRGETARIITGKVKKENVIAFFDRRKEQEIVCFPEHVFDKSMERVS